MHPLHTALFPDTSPGFPRPRTPAPAPAPAPAPPHFGPTADRAPRAGPCQLRVPSRSTAPGHRTARAGPAPPSHPGSGTLRRNPAAATQLPARPPARHSSCRCATLRRVSPPPPDRFALLDQPSEGPRRPASRRRPGGRFLRPRGSLRTGPKVPGPLYKRARDAPYIPAALHGDAGRQVSAFLGDPARPSGRVPTNSTFHALTPLLQKAPLGGLRRASLLGRIPSPVRPLPAGPHRDRAAHLTRDRSQGVGAAGEGSPPRHDP